MATNFEKIVSDKIKNGGKETSAQLLTAANSQIDIQIALLGAEKIKAQNKLNAAKREVQNATYATEIGDDYLYNISEAFESQAAAEDEVADVEANVARYNALKTEINAN